MRHSLIGLVLTASLASALAQTPTVTLTQALDVWAHGVTWVEQRDDTVVFHDCQQTTYPALRGRYDFDAERLMFALEPLTGRLVTALAPIQLQFAETVRASRLSLVRGDLNRWWWATTTEQGACALDAATVQLIARAVLDAGFVLGDGFGDPAPIMESAQTEPCTKGRCDCADCPPGLSCDCKTARDSDGDGVYDDCRAPRFNCSTSTPKGDIQQMRPPNPTGFLR